MATAQIADWKKGLVAQCERLPDNLQALTVVGCKNGVPLLWLILAQEGQRLVKKARAKYDKNNDGVVDADTWLGRWWGRWQVRAAAWALILVAALLVVEDNVKNTQKVTERFVRILAKNIDVVVLFLGSVLDVPRSWLVPLESAAFALKDVAHDAVKSTPATTWFAIFPATAKLFDLIAPSLDVFNKKTAKAVLSAIFTERLVSTYFFGEDDDDAAAAAAKKKKDDDAEETKEGDLAAPPTPTPVWATLGLFAVWIAVGATLDVRVLHNLIDASKTILKDAIVAFFGRGSS
mmetsp:Transcript_11615/g.34783  ORF Transcript_11615/g.34783 Transcript_11615/m.34783 type:complete len:291 (+) Transcript_11615:68-940(+)